MACQTARQIVAGKRVSLERQGVQFARPLLATTPGLPECKEIVSQAKAGFTGGELISARPALGQSIATDEHMLGLGQRAGPRMIYVSVAFTGRGAQRIEMQFSGFEWRVPSSHVLTKTEV